MRIPDLVADYVTALRRAGLAARTIESYRPRLLHFARWLGPDAGCGNLTEAVCQAYLDAMIAGGARPRTVRGAVSALRSFGRWATGAGHLTHNPAEALRGPRLDAPRRERPSDDLLSDAFGACERILDRRRGALARATLAVLVYSGARRAELLGMHVADVSLHDGALRIRHGKGSKERIVFVCRECVEALRGWLAVRGRCAYPHLFGLDGRRHLGDNGLRTLLREVAALAGHRNDPALLPHALRRRYATALAWDGVDLRTIQQALGHADATTTLMYLGSDLRRMSEIAERAALRPSNVPMDPGTVGSSRPCSAVGQGNLHDPPPGDGPWRWLPVRHT